MTILGNLRLEALESGPFKPAAAITRTYFARLTLHISLQLRALLWRIIPLPSFISRFYVTNPVSTQLVCTIAVLGAMLYLRSAIFPPLVSPLILNILDPVPLLVIQTEIASVNPSPQRG